MGNADGSILLATHPIIASEFNDLGNSSWLITSFTLAGAATQTLVSLLHPMTTKWLGILCSFKQKKYGKLSDIYGRKSLVIIAYTIFMVGWYVPLESNEKCSN